MRGKGSKKATVNCWIYKEDYEFLTKKVSFQEKFADAIHKLCEEQGDYK